MATEVPATDLTWTFMVTAHNFGRWAAQEIADLPGGQRGHLVMATIAYGQPPSQLALAQQLGVDRTAMTYLLDQLEDAGLVERRPDPADRRARLVSLTPRGHAMLATIAERLTSTTERLLAPLSPTEAATFQDLLCRVAIAAHDPPGTQG